MSYAAPISGADDFDSLMADCGASLPAQPSPDALDDHTHTSPRTGRPPVISDALKEEALILAANGATEREIASQLDINVLTLYRAKRDDEAFCTALNAWKSVADEEVEKSLFNRARGFTHKVEKVFSYQGEIVRAEVNEYVIPDTGAATLWLKNRQPDRWRDKTDVNVSMTLMDILAQTLAPTEQPPAIEGTAVDVSGPDTDNV